MFSLYILCVVGDVTDLLLFGGLESVLAYEPGSDLFQLESKVLPHNNSTKIIKLNSWMLTYLVQEHSFDSPPPPERLIALWVKTAAACFLGPSSVPSCLTYLTNMLGYE